MSPVVAMPAAAAIMFCSAIPKLKERSGNVAANIVSPSYDFSNAWPKRISFRTGGLIMIHGQPNTPRKPRDYYASNDWTDGCIAVSNSDMVDIWLRTTVGIPIEIRP